MSARKLVLVLAFSLAETAFGQTPPASAPASDTPTAATRRCESAQRRVAKEERALATADESLAANRKALETCSDRTLCARYDSAIKSTEARRARHDTRLTRFRGDTQRVCKPG